MSKVRLFMLLLVMLMCAGCGPSIQIGPKNLNIPHDRPQRAQQLCSPINKLPPLDEVVTIRIRPNESVTADFGGEKLLKSYGALRVAINDGTIGKCSQ